MITILLPYLLTFTSYDLGYTVEHFHAASFFGGNGRRLSASAPEIAAEDEKPSTPEDRVDLSPEKYRHMGHNGG